MYPENLLSESESLSLAEWLREHNKTCAFADPKNQGAIGGRLTFEFTPTYLGMVSKIRCACGASVDVTDYSW